MENPFMTHATIEETAKILADRLDESFVPAARRRFLFIRGDHGFDRLHAVRGSKVMVAQGGSARAIKPAEAITRAILVYWSQHFQSELTVEWRDAMPEGYGPEIPGFQFGGTNFGQARIGE